MSGSRPTHPRLLRATRPWQRDLAVALALAAVSSVEISGAADIDEPWLVGAATLACTLGLVVRRRHPVALAIGISVALVLTALRGQPLESIGILVTVVVAVWSLSTERAMRPALAGAAVLAVGVAASILGDPSDSAWNIPPTLFLFVAVPFAAGLALRERSRRGAREALALERARIARELHDVVAHGVSLIALQADAAGSALQHDPARAAAPVEAIAVTARACLVELRRLLDIVRAPEDEDPRAPRPGVARLPELVDGARRAGLQVDLRIEGEVGDLAPGIDLAVFRVAQEALTNALKHAAMARVAVTLRYRAADVEIEVVDDGRPPPATEEGFGLMGMRERVGLYGGRVDAGPRPGGGYGVLATLPL